MKIYFWQKQKITIDGFNREKMFEKGQIKIKEFYY